MHWCLCSADMPPLKSILPTLYPSQGTRPHRPQWLLQPPGKEGILYIELERSMYGIVLGEQVSQMHFITNHNSSSPRYSCNSTSMFNLKKMWKCIKYPPKGPKNININTTLALDNDGILLHEVPSQASAVLVPISASHTGFTWNTKESSLCHHIIVVIMVCYQSY